jgi:hypothetical protein
MSIGTQRRNSYGKEVGGWGAFFTTVKVAAASGTATTFTTNNGGGSTFGTAPVAAGMKIVYQDNLAEPTSLISAVTGLTNTGGVVTGDAVVTIPAMVNGTVSAAVNARVAIGYFPDKSLLLDKFTSKKNMNKWSSNAYTGTRAKAVSRRKGQVDADGSMEFMLRPSANVGIASRAIGLDGVVGSTPTGTSTITATFPTAVADTTFKSAGTYASNDIVQIGAGATSECRKVTVVGTPVGGYTVDVGFLYAHAAGEAVAKVVAPYLHTIPSAVGNLPSIAMEDYVPWDDGSTITGSAKYSYYVPGAVLKSLKLTSQSDTGPSATLEYEGQDKIKIPAQASLGVPNEAPFIFEQEAVLIGGTRNYRIRELTLEINNDLQKVWTKQGSARAFAIKAGQQEVKGTMKFFLDDTTQALFWAALEADTQLAFLYTVTDAVTGYYITFQVNKIVIDEFNDSDFAPGDLVNGEVTFTAILDAAGTNEQIRMIASNGDYLNY